MREHQFDFDLSQHAGKTVKLRLQVKPGPKNNPSWDWSFFGDAKLIVGNGQNGRQEWLKQLTGTRAYTATSKVSLLAFSNAASAIASVRRICCPAPTNWSAPPTNGGLVTRARFGPLTFTFIPVTGTLDDFTAQDWQGPFVSACDGRRGDRRAETGENETEEILARGAAIWRKCVGKGTR